MKNIKRLRRVSGGVETTSETYVHQIKDQVSLAGRIAGDLNVVENQDISKMPASVLAMYKTYNY